MADYSETFQEIVKISATEVLLETAFVREMEDIVAVSTTGADTTSALYPGLTLRPREFEVHAP